MNNRLCRAVTVAVLCLQGAVSALAQPVAATTNFEEREGFKPGAWTGDERWLLPAGATGRIVTPGFEGGQAAEVLTSGWVLHKTPSESVGKGAVMWLDFWVKTEGFDQGEPTAFAGSPRAAEVYTYVGGQGEERRLYVSTLDAAGEAQWVELPRPPKAAAAPWLRLSYRLDYTSRRYDFYVDGEVARVDLPFVGPGIAPQPFVAVASKGAAPLGLDSVYVGAENPLFPDSGKTGLPDEWLQSYGLPLLTTARDGDPDGDGVFNIAEYAARTHPVRRDTDGDGMPDPWELKHALDARINDAQLDPDEDGLTHGAEYRLGTDPHRQNRRVRGAVSLEIWKNPPTTDARRGSVRNLTASARFGQASDQTVVLTSLDKESSGQKNYGGRVQGFIEAPADGAYEFWIAADDDAELWLSSDETPFQRTRIAWTGTVTPRHDYEKNAMQHSRPMTLVAGRSYAFELLYKQGSGEDHFSVQWQRPDGTREIVPGAQLQTYFPRDDDRDNDGLPDDWEIESGLSAAHGGGRDGARGDPDGDGVPNLAEFQAGFSPTRPNNGVAGGVFLEAWDGVGGSKIADLTNHKRFSTEADQLTFLRKLEAVETLRPQSGGRVRGHLVPPQTGAYEFLVAGDDNAEFWISSDEQPFNRRRAAWTASSTRPGQYTKYPSQRSVPLNLEQGKRYYFELLHKQNSGGEHFSVAWAHAGGEPQVISGEHLQTFAVQADDKDKDGLPDDWEITHGVNPLLAYGANGAYQTGRFQSTHLAKFQTGLGVTALNERVPGVVLMEEWGNLPGRRVWHLTTSGKFAGKPDTFAVLKSLEIAGAFSLSSGARARGFLVPDATADYEFWIAGDDNAEFWLSPDETVTQRTKTAWTDGFTLPHEYDFKPTQHSRPIRLEQGRAYYFEVITKQGSGENHVAVAWQKPGSARAVIGAAHLRSFSPAADDLDGDGLPDAWETTHGLSAGIASGPDGLDGDPDLDRVSNLAEYKLGLDPAQPDTDGDGLSDGDELAAGEDPLKGPAAYAQGLPAAWTEVSSDDVPAAAWHTGNQLLVKASGRNFQDGAEIAGMAYRTVSGNFAYSSQVLIGEHAEPDVEGGVIVRTSLDENSPFLALTKGKDYGWLLRYRASPSAPPVWDRVHANLEKFTTVQVRRIGHLVSVFGQTPEGVLRPLAEYPLPFATSEAVVGHIVWARSYTPRAAMLFVAGELQTNFTGAGLPDFWKGGFDSVKWMGEWDGTTNPVSASAPLPRQPSLAELSAGPLHVTTPVRATGTSATGRKGPWTAHGEALVAGDRRGELTWKLPVKAGAIYLLEILVREGLADRTVSSSFPLKVFVDGEYVGTRAVAVDPQATAAGLWFTPWLPPGEHTITMIWDGAASGTRLAVQGAGLHHLEGPDFDANGVADWMDKRLAQFNGIDKVSTVVPIVELAPDQPINPQALVGTYPQLAPHVAAVEFVSAGKDRQAKTDDVLRSVVSPMPLEGAAHWPGLTQLTADGEAVPVHAGAGYRWFAQVPLKADQPTTLKFFGENGGVQQRLSARWEAYDPATGGTLSLVAGSTLLVGAPGKGKKQATLTLDGVPLDAAGKDAVLLPFATAGTYELRATGGALPRPVVTTIVVSAPTAPAVWPGLFTRERIFTATDFVPGIRFEGDPRLGLITFQSTPKTLVWATDDNVDRTVVARAGATGPVLGALAAPGSKIYSTMDTYNLVTATLPDGTREVETLVILSPLRPDHGVRLEIFVAGVLFADGTRVKDLAAGDFDELGQARVTFLWPADANTSVCHRTHLLYKGEVVSTK